MSFLKYKTIKSPVGLLKIIANEKALVAILWDNEKINRVKLNEMVEDKTHSILLETEKQLQEYFNGQRKVFELPIEIKGTVFQIEVWNLLNKIPFGSTWTYKDIALKMKKPNAVRAVGSAIGRNPVSIIIPCHRVIASNGSLSGFAGGTDRKKILLDLESNSHFSS